MSENNMFEWSSAQYMKFGNERTQPSVDLINRIEITPQSILDVGCGPGNSTAVLAQRFSAQRILGVDSSADMLTRAKSTYSGIDFKQCRVPDGLDSLGESFDLVFSNACIHWIPDQINLIKKLLSVVNDGGALAVQIPLTQKATFYEILNSLVDSGRWSKLKSIKNFHNLMPDEYYAILSEISCRFDLWETVYYHKTDSFEGIIEWYKGSGLRPHLNALNVEEQRAFSAELLDKIKDSYTRLDNGSVILKMPRMFFCVYK